MQKQISSYQNPLIKKIVQLQQKSKLRKKNRLFIIEGVKECQLAQKSNYQFETVLICNEIVSQKKLLTFLNTIDSNVKIIDISKQVYQKISHRKTTEGIIVIAKSKEFKLTGLTLPENPLILVAEAPEKPGNIGAILRTADAANIDLVLIANAKTDMYNPNIIRSSVGCVFTNKIALGSTSEILEFLKNNNISIFSAALRNDSISYTDINFKNASAIVVGTESEGLSDLWLQNSTKNIFIPMEGEIDSLNVSVSAAILIFEAKRQRKVGIS